MYSMYLMSNLVYGINKNQNSLSCGLILRLMSTLIFMLKTHLLTLRYLCTGTPQTCSALWVRRDQINQREIHRDDQ